jgi:Rv2525c-like, glycoside hydrolase-like domain
MALLIDATSSPSVASMQAAGVTCISRYLGPTGLSKVIHAAEYASLRSAGMQVQLNWENFADDWSGIHGSGASDGASAVSQAKALGHPAGCAIVGSADFDMSLATWSAGGHAYATGFANAVRSGGYVAGVYGPWNVLGWCQATGLFGVFWQAGMSTSWSGGQNANLWPGAQIRQRRKGTIGGVSVDFSDVIIENYGQAGGNMTTLDGEQAGQLYNSNSWPYGMANLFDEVQIAAGNNTAVIQMGQIPLSKAIKDIRDNVKALIEAPTGTTVDVTQEMLNVAMTAAIAANVDAIAAALARHIQVS